MKIGINFCCVLAILSADALSLNANVTVPDSVAEPGVEQMDTLVVESNGEPEINSLFQLGSNVPTHLTSVVGWCRGSGGRSFVSCAYPISY